MAELDASGIALAPGFLTVNWSDADVVLANALVLRARLVLVRGIDRVGCFEHLVWPSNDRCTGPGRYDSDSCWIRRLLQYLCRFYSMRGGLTAPILGTCGG